MADDPLKDLQELQYEMGAVYMALVALIKSHPDPQGFAIELQLMTGDLQVTSAALAGPPMPEKTRQVLLSLLGEVPDE